MDWFPSDDRKKNWVIDRIQLFANTVSTLHGGIFGGIMGRSGFETRFIIGWDIRKRQRIF
jgi:hypothetical protein